MNRIIEIVAMAVGGLSLFLVCFVGFVAMSGKDMSQVAVIGKLFPPPDEDAQLGEVHAVEQDGDQQAAIGNMHGRLRTRGSAILAQAAGRVARAGRNS